MTIDNYKVEQLLELLTIKWSKGRKDFIALMVAMLIGNVYTVTLICT